MSGGGGRDANNKEGRAHTHTPRARPQKRSLFDRSLFCCFHRERGRRREKKARKRATDRNERKHEKYVPPWKKEREKKS